MSVPGLVDQIRLLTLVAVLLFGSPGSAGGPPDPATTHGSTPPAPAAPSPSPSDPAPRPGGREHVVALGDSVTSGYHCDCTPFPALYAAAAGRANRSVTTVTNLGQPGLDTAGLLSELADGRGRVAREVATAQSVLVTIGANDFGSDHDDVVGGRCPSSQTDDCLADELRAMGTRLDAIMDRIRQLHGSRPFKLLVTGYWNVFEDGTVAREAFSDAGRRSTRWLTEDVNNVVRASARRVGASYVDLRPVFARAAGARDDLLADDGDHPDAAGHAAIAQALLDAPLHADG